ncbi:hypothetical protein AB1L88_19430 [Tautonia sp. JC769]|uniref:hypothetical protein n=1 Tax=Tautonia sp. JC769 TaxID=3232135 RepID=UPI0034596635
MPVLGVSGRSVRLGLGGLAFEFAVDPSRRDSEAIGRAVDRLVESLDPDADGEGHELPGIPVQQSIGIQGDGPGAGALQM